LLDARAYARRHAAPPIEDDGADIVLALAKLLAGGTDSLTDMDVAIAAMKGAPSLLGLIATPPVEPERQLAAVEALSPVVDLIVREVRLRTFDRDADGVGLGTELWGWRMWLDPPPSTDEQVVWVQRAVGAISVLTYIATAGEDRVFSAVKGTAGARLAASRVLDDPAQFDPAVVLGRSLNMASEISSLWWEAVRRGEVRCPPQDIDTDELCELAAGTVIGAWTTA
jgi:hypothetical protein